MASALIDQIREVVGRAYPHWASSADPADEPGRMAGSANYLVGAAVRCVIAERDEDALRLLRRAESWLTAALERASRGEPIDELYFEVDAHVDLDLCRWLTESPAGRTDISRGCALLREHLASLPPKGAGREWDWALPILLLGGDTALVVAEFERAYPKFSMATVRKRGQAGMAYLLARRPPEKVAPADEVAEATQEFLNRFVPELIKGGLFSSCAMWVKLLAPPQAGERPVALLRRVVLDHAD